MAKLFIQQNILSEYYFLCYMQFCIIQLHLDCISTRIWWQVVMWDNITNTVRWFFHLFRIPLKLFLPTFAYSWFCAWSRRLQYLNNLNTDFIDDTALTYFLDLHLAISYTAVTKSNFLELKTQPWTCFNSKVSRTKYNHKGQINLIEGLITNKCTPYPHLYIFLN